MIVDGARRAGGAYITRRVGAGVQRGGPVRYRNRENVSRPSAPRPQRAICVLMRKREDTAAARSRSTVTTTII